MNVLKQVLRGFAERGVELTPDELLLWISEETQSVPRAMELLIDAAENENNLLLLVHHYKQWRTVLGGN